MTHKRQTPSQKNIWAPVTKFTIMEENYKKIKPCFWLLDWSSENFRKLSIWYL